MSDPTGTHLAPVPDLPPAAEPKRKTKIKKLRLLAILVPLAALAVISTIFGMMMAVASDLPSLEQLPQVAKRKNSVLTDIRGRRLTTLTSNQGRIIVSDPQISSYAKYAVIAVEDERFYQNSGVDLRGIGRAFVQDVVQGRQAQGGSTIAQQFVKNALQAQTRRTVFEKLREAAMAYHLTRKWSKERILTEYLNTVYFGNGAYGIEAAARTYFSADPNHKDCGQPKHPMCAEQLTPAEGALLAAIIASPSGYDPVAHPAAAMARRNLVLKKMLDQNRITPAVYADAIHEQLFADITPPHFDSPKGTEYFVSWVRQSLVDQVGPQRAFEGDLNVKTTLDLDLQNAATTAVNKYLSWAEGPTASVVVLDNNTGEVRAMVGGRDYEKMPFNLATQGQRQPGSSIKPFILAEALRQGIGPGTVFPSRKRFFTVSKGSKEQFVVNNFENEYAGQSTIANALTFSDNAVFAALGIKVGTKKVAKLAERMGIRTPVSSNLAMTLGGLRQGVTPLDMAHAYETFASGGKRITGSLGTSDAGPVGIHEITKRSKDKDVVKKNKVIGKRVLSEKLASEATQLMTGPVKFGTATRAQYGGFAAGKTGTTENSGDAWFVGFTPRWTIAVWVGYPTTLKPMLSEFQGSAVTGGTFPAMIWHDFVVAANKIVDDRNNAERKKKGLPPLEETTSVPATTQVAPSTAPREGAAPEGAGTTGGETGGTDGTDPAPVQTTPKTTTPSTGTGGGTGTGNGTTGGGTGSTGTGNGTSGTGNGTSGTGTGNGTSGTGQTGGDGGTGGGGTTGGDTGGTGAPTGGTGAG
ncbi:transglycosylase domain-containing protein [Baekduia sp. Peel2402]|uniref:transglycosylase domain-containing protein n=1 Tax=Baekduia sp. Peel2402 TaxID=3458296 RepID=UPI00403E46D7